MKKTLFILTFMIYLFSIVAEAGVFSSHSESENANYGVSYNVEKTQTQQLTKNCSDLASGSCPETNCHVGHCHHTSTLGQFLINPNLNNLSKYNSSVFATPLNPYLDGLKRPPRIS